MRGYFHRLVRSVRQAEETIHPVVGSVFSAPEIRPAETAPQAEGFDLAARQTRTEVEDHRSIHLQAPEPIFAEREDRAVRAAAPSIAPGEIVKQAPSVATVYPSSQAAPPGSPAGSREEPASGSGGRTPVQEAPMPARVPLPDQGAYETLVARPSRPDRNPAPPRQTRLGGSPPRPERKPALSEAARDEPDEISIHIGRIEVTAVQAAPAPAVRRARKGPSLEEYLRRRDRRTS